MISLTYRQRALLAFIVAYQREHGGVSPCFREMSEGAALNSKQRVHECLNALEERGAIRRVRNRARAIEVLAEPAPVPMCFIPADDLHGPGVRVLVTA